MYEFHNQLPLSVNLLLQPVIKCKWETHYLLLQTLINRVQIMKWSLNYEQTRGLFGLSKTEIAHTCNMQDSHETNNICAWYIVFAYLLL